MRHYLLVIAVVIIFLLVRLVINRLIERKKKEFVRANVKKIQDFLFNLRARKKSELKFDVLWLLRDLDIRDAVPLDDLSAIHNHLAAADICSNALDCFNCFQALYYVFEDYDNAFELLLRAVLMGDRKFLESDEMRKLVVSDASLFPTFGYEKMCELRKEYHHLLCEIYSLMLADEVRARHTRAS